MMWLGRLAAWLVFILGFVAAVLAMDAGEWKSLALVATVASVALWLALAADRRIVGDRRRRKAEELQVWSGTAIVVHLQWVAWFLINVLVVMLGALFAVGFRFGNLWFRLMALIAVPSAAVLLLGSVRLAIWVLRSGYLLRLDAQGVHPCGRGTIPWSSVQEVALGSTRTQYRTLHTLDFVLKPPLKKLQVGFSLIDVDPDLLLQAARVIAGRAGVRVSLPALTEWPLSEEILEPRHG